MQNKKLTFVAAMIGVAAITRLIPHPWNFTPIGAMALFAGAQLENKWLAFLTPLVALFLGDLVLGFHRLMPFVYACFVVTVCLGFWVQRSTSTPRVVAASLLSSTIFFLVTNFSVWALLGTYPRNALGLMECYIAGLPTFRNGAVGDLVYNGILFGGLAFAQRSFPSLRDPRAFVTR
jgi:hypothetical protein